MKRRVPRLSGAARGLARGELVGLQCRVAASGDAGIVGLTGEVVDETLHTLTLRVGGPGGRRIRLAKVGTTFALRPSDERDWTKVEGAALEFRPTDRTKKVR